MFQTTGSRVDAAVAKASPPQPYVVLQPLRRLRRASEPSASRCRAAATGAWSSATSRSAAACGSTRCAATWCSTLHAGRLGRGYVAWDLRTKDNLDVAPGLYVYQVDAPGVGEPDRQVRDRSSDDARHASQARSRRSPSLTDRRAPQARAQTKTGTHDRRVPADRAERAHRRAWATRASPLPEGSTPSTTTPRAISSDRASGRVTFSHSRVARGHRLQLRCAAACRWGLRQRLRVGDVARLRARSTSAPSSQPLGTGERFTVSDIAVGLGYAIEITDRFTVGGQVTFVQETIWHSSASTMTLELGIALPDLRIGACASARASPNFGTEAHVLGPRSASHVRSGSVAQWRQRRLAGFAGYRSVRAPGAVPGRPRACRISLGEDQVLTLARRRRAPEPTTPRA